jgi:hypothetical protein
MSMLRLRSHRGLGLSPRRRKAKGAAQPSIVPDGLLAEWRFDEGAGTTLTDFSGNGHHGTLGADSAAPTWTSAGLSFDGGDHVTLPAFNPSGNEITVWVAINNVSATTDEFFLSMGDFGPSDLSWFMTYGSGGVNYRAGVDAVGNFQNATTSDREHQTSDYAVDAWMALAFSFDGSALKLFRNGDELTSNVTGRQNATALHHQTTGGFIGGLFNTTPVDRFSGHIAYVTVNEVAMDADQVAQQYQALRSIMAARGISLP